MSHPGSAPTVPGAGPTRLVAVLAFDAMEVLDHAGPLEVFGVTGDLTEPPAFEVVTVGLGTAPVTARGGLRVVPDHDLDDCPVPDILVVPGGAGVRALLDDERLLGWVRDRAAEAECVLSVCTGALVLAAAGLLERRRATTHHDATAELAAMSPTTQVERGPRFVRSGERLWTSAGVSAGIDLSLHLVRELVGVAAHDATVAEMEWMWRS